MKQLQYTVKTLITDDEESGYVGTCFGLPVVTQGDTLDKAVKNLEEAVALHFAGEDNSQMGYMPNSMLVFSNKTGEYIHHDVKINC